VIRAERSGWVYFSLFIGNGIGRINMETHEIEIFHTDQLAGIGAEDTIDRAGGVWYSFFDVNKLARLDTDTFQFSYVQFPGTLLGGLNPNGVLSDVLPAVDVAVNYGPGDAVWFTDVPKNRVGRYRIDGQFGPPAEGVRISM
jgi:streptogramin lyase